MQQVNESGAPIFRLSLTYDGPRAVEALTYGIVVLIPKDDVTEARTAGRWNEEIDQRIATQLDNRGERKGGDTAKRSRFTSAGDPLEKQFVTRAVISV
jgi:hypothetical protein